MGVAGNGKFFLSLLPPKKVLDAPEPVAAQLQFAPDQSEVVRLSEIMKDQPYHPSLTLQKALARLAPTCRKLWNHMDWISGTVAQVWDAMLCLYIGFGKIIAVTGVPANVRYLLFAGVSIVWRYCSVL